MTKLDVGSPTQALRRLHRWRMALAGFVILVAGITLGAAGTMLLVKPVERQPPRDPDVAAQLMSRRVQEELGLSPEQVKQIESILRTHMGELEALRKEARPKIEAVFETMNAKVAEVLTEVQREEWQRFAERVDRVFQRGFRPRGPRGDGPRGQGPGRFGPPDQGGPGGGSGRFGDDRPDLDGEPGGRPRRRGDQGERGEEGRPRGRSRGPDFRRPDPNEQPPGEGPTSDGQQPVVTPVEEPTEMNHEGEPLQ